MKILAQKEAFLKDSQNLERITTTTEGNENINTNINQTKSYISRSSIKKDNKKPVNQNILFSNELILDRKDTLHISNKSWNSPKFK